ncbi:hypothetical protein HYFRA_00001106 [Hymenoscyphus fraxineus]|uniref:thioredoxin-dependent peroxiredoxin n=1 Tax=Hymenoscyphus fraxineus TaxID=746836 RepID=A0A9N9KQQ5_9HELO|nr:hypothetical protein HYFRA_00001106 [Hymenoscyphus fraxineus]
MPRELRKRKAPEEPVVTAPAAKKKGPVAKVVAKVKETVAPKAAAASKVEVGATIDLEGFGGEIETQEGAKVTLKQLVDESKSGVVLFTYPKASTPGCTKQACEFRDKYTPLTATGFSIFGLSKDSPKANTTFKEKQKLPYPLLCDPSAALISAIGLKKAPAGTTRGVFVVDKSGKVLAAQAGSPSGTVEVVEKLVAEGSSEPVEAKDEVATNGTNGATKEDEAKAEVAAQVADTAEKLDGNEGKIVAA